MKQTSPFAIFRWAFVTVLLLLLIWVCVGVSRNLATPQITIPVSTLPTPNAFDLYVDAAELLVRTDDVDDAVSQQTQKAWPLPEKVKLLRENRSALEAFDEGTKHSYCQPSSRSLTDSFSYFAKFRSYARLKSLEARVFSEQRQPGKAIGAALDTMQFGDQITEGASLIGGLVGIACQAIGRAPAWDTIDRLSAVEARAATQRMETLYADEIPFWRCLDEEKRCLQASMLEIMDKPGMFTDMIQGTQGATGSPGNANAGAAAMMPVFYFAVVGKQHSMDTLTQQMNLVIERQKRPYEPNATPITGKGDVFSQIVIPAVDGAEFKGRYNRAQNGMLLLALALRTFQAENGRYPASLKELTPRYLKQLPDDSFAPSGTFAYRVTNGKPLLYSIGPDGRDDGGKPIENTQYKDKRRFNSQKESKGDMVAGINR